ncbi:MAG: DUF1573 domain-containing protein [Algoriphagus aquaeductus]|jgi:hypothetical protein|uniref:DUF1573 domain-containing protein n=1 Tax=Algoriphagus aquaeductus TaxID=475299 RepID=UPI003918E5F4
MISLGNYFISILCIVFLFRVNEVSDLVISPKVKVVTAKDQNNEGDIIVNFKLQNSGLQEIQIISVSPHCSCTDYKLSDPRIGVGKTVTLTLTVPWAQLSSLGDVYAVLKTDSKQKFVKVSIKADRK